MTQFIVVAYDAKDPGAYERRMEHRHEHLIAIQAARDNGTMLCGAAITDENDKMIGSVIITNFSTRAEFDAWLKSEPFVRHKVWGEVTVLNAKLAPPFADLIRKVS